MDGETSQIKTLKTGKRPTQEAARWFTTVFVASSVSLILGVVTWSAVRRTAADPSASFSLQQKPFLNSSPISSLKVATFNIHSGKGMDGVRDLSRVVDTIPTDVDFVWLNEVRSGMFGMRDDQSLHIAKEMKRAFVFLPTETQYYHGHFGNAILTRRELTSIQYLPLPCSQQKRFRNAVLTTIQLSGTPVRILATHLDENVDRLQQLQQIRSLFESLKAPAVLLGDLNTRNHEPEMQAFFERASQTHVPVVVNALDGKTGNRDDGHGVDWIISKGLDVIDAGLVENDASDHPLLWAELKLSKRIQIAHKNH